MNKKSERKPYKVIRNFPTASRVYRKDDGIVFLDRFVARAMKARGVIREPTKSELEKEGFTTEPKGGEDSTEPGPSATPEGEGPSERKEGFSAAWLEQAKEALKSGNGNKIRSALSKVAETSKLKTENQNRLAKLVASAEEAVGE